MDSTTTSAAAAHDLDALAAAVREALQVRYEHPVVVVQPEHERVAVLAGKPLELVREALDPADAARVTELDPGDLPWFAVPVEGLQLWRQHGRVGETGELVTELESGDPPLQMVVLEQGWRLVRLLDGAQGWLSPDAPALDPLAAAASASTSPDLDDLRDTAKVDPLAFVAAALEYEGVEYVWGGTTARGVDCSGIVQRAAWRSAGCWLPRHSRALLRAGARVKPSAIEAGELAAGDVLVLQREKSTYAAEEQAQLEAQAAREQATGAVPSHGPAIHPMHVAIAISPTEALHASRDAMCVVREPIATLRERYRVLGVRRLGPAPTELDQHDPKDSPA